MAPGIHEDRRRANSFGDDPERYDRARPTYPDGLVDDLMAASSLAGRDGPGGRPLDVVDVGCGTGIAGRLFAARGCRVVGVEADARMAAVARRRGMTVEVAPFETWDRSGRTFDLLISAQAWHWIDPDVGAVRAAECLRRAGRFAAFWNEVLHRPEVLAALTPAYEEVAPQLLGTSVALGGPRQPAERDGRDPDGEFLSRTGNFTDVAVWRYRWERTYRVEQWLDYLASVSDHHVLPADRFSELLDSLRVALGTLGDTITVDYESRALTARRC